MATRAKGQLQDAIFLAFSLEALSTTQKPNQWSLCDFTVCIPHARIKFDGADGVSQKSPTHANAIVCVPGSYDYSETFVRTFSKLGSCMYGVNEADLLQRPRIPPQASVPR
jgi:hypothetical protein